MYCTIVLGSAIINAFPESSLWFC